MSDGSRKPPTIVDVAEAAGVSKSTVSNVVRGVPVSAETRDRVLAAIRQLGYRPNAIARQFAQQQSTTLGVVTGPLSNPWHGEMATALEGVASRMGFMTSFCNVEGDERDLAAASVEALLDQRVMGILILAPVLYVPRLQAALRETGVPAVFVGQTEPWADSIDVANEDGGRLATEHLLSMGHRRIAYVRTLDVEENGDRLRMVGYQRAMRNAGERPLPVYEWEPGSDRISISGASKPLGVALRGASAPTGVFVATDNSAIALIDACEARGIEVPRDLSVVGFDDIPISSLRRISLTTVSFSFEQLAEEVMAALMERVNGTRDDPKLVCLPCGLKVRGSTAPAPRS